MRYWVNWQKINKLPYKMFSTLYKILSEKKQYPFETLFSYGYIENNFELIALLFAEQPCHGYYYAHIAQHPVKKCWISCIVYSSSLIIGKNHQDWINNFHYWVKVRLDYEPVSYQVANYSYAESIHLDSAAKKLEKMIANFNIEAVYQENENDHPSNPQIIEFYGLQDVRNENGEYPPISQYIDIIYH